MGEVIKILPDIEEIKIKNTDKAKGKLDWEDVCDRAARPKKLPGMSYNDYTAQDLDSIYKNK